MKSTMINIGLVILRVLMGAGIANHGYAKLFGGRMAGFTDGVGEMGFPLPALFAWLAASSEFLGGILIAIGLATRPAALFVFCTMSVAAFVRHGADPLSAKELALAYWTISLSLMFTGAGAYSVDRFFRRG